MTVAIQNYPKFKYTIASTGQPGAGYKLFTYEEGNSTKQTTWTSLSKSAENTNPIILDANGEADVWIDGDYKLVLAPPTDTDPPTSPIWTYDAIRSEDISTTASTEGEIPTNGSFETDTDANGIPDNWTVAELSGGTIALDTASSSNGTNSLKFTSTGSGAGSASTDEYYRVEAGKVVGVKFSLISDDVDTLNKVQVYWYNSVKTYLSTSDAYNEGAANPTLWTRKYLNVTAPATAKYARIILTGVDAASTTHSNTWFDNVEFDASFTGELDSSIQLDLNNLTATSTELNYSDGVTSNIQTQIGDTAGRRGALVYITSNQDITGGTDETIDFTAEDYDTDSIHDNSTNNSRLTVPTGITKVRLTAQVTGLSTVADGDILIRLSETTVHFYAGALKKYMPLTSTSNASSHNLISPILNVTGGDYFEIVVTETSTGTVNIIGSAQGYSTWFAMEIIE